MLDPNSSAHGAVSGISFGVTLRRLLVSGLVLSCGTPDFFLPTPPTAKAKTLIIALDQPPERTVQVFDLQTDPVRLIRSVSLEQRAQAQAFAYEDSPQQLGLQSGELLGATIEDNDTFSLPPSAMSFVATIQSDTPLGWSALGPVTTPLEGWFYRDRQAFKAVGFDLYNYADNTTALGVDICLLGQDPKFCTATAERGRAELPRVPVGRRTLLTLDGDPFFPSLFMLRAPQNSGATDLRIPIFEQQVIQFARDILELSPDRSLGWVGFSIAENEALDPLAGVRVLLDPPAGRTALVDTSFFFSVEEGDVTNESGLGFFAHVPPGRYQVVLETDRTCALLDGDRTWQGDQPNSFPIDVLPNRATLLSPAICALRP